MKPPLNEKKNLIPRKLFLGLFSFGRLLPIIGKLNFGRPFFGMSVLAKLSPYQLEFYKFPGDRKALAFLTLFSLFACKAYAFQSSPEYWTLTEKERLDFDDPNQIDSESASDFFTYQKPMDWDYDWIADRQLLDLTVGSIGSNYFLIDQRIRIKQWLTEKLEFRFTYSEQRDFEQEFQHHTLELSYWFFSQLGLSLYGETSFLKTENDQGLALLFKPGQQHLIRLYWTRVDFDRNKRNTGTDRIVNGNEPHVYGLVGRWWKQRLSESIQRRPEYLEYSFRYESPTDWLWPDRGELYQFQRSQVSLRAQWNWSATQSSAMRFQYDNKWEETTSTTRTPELIESWARERYLSQLDFRQQLGKYEIKPYAHYAHKTWLSNQRPIAFDDLILGLEWSWPKFGSSLQQQFLLAYEWAQHQGEDAYDLLSFGVKNHKLEHRSNLTYLMQFFEGSIEGSFQRSSDKQEQALSELRLLLTFDVDRFGTGETWEGGNAQFRLFF